MAEKEDESSNYEIPYDDFNSESWLSSTFSDMEESETDESSDYVTPSYDVEESEGDKSFDHETFSTIP